VKSILIVARRDCFGDLALHFDSAVVCDQQILSTLGFDLGCRQGRGKHTDRGMNQQTVHPVLAGGELSVVVVVDVDSYSIGKSREAGGKPHRGSQHRRAAAWAKAERFQILLNQFPGLGFGPAESESQTIQDRLPAKFERFHGDVRELEVHDKLSRMRR